MAWDRWSAGPAEEGCHGGMVPRCELGEAHTGGGAGRLLAMLIPALNPTLRQEKGTEIQTGLLCVKIRPESGD